MSRAVYPVSPFISGSQVTRKAMDEDPLPNGLFDGQSQAVHCRNRSGQDISRTCRGHPRISAEIDENTSVGISDEGVGPF